MAFDLPGWLRFISVHELNWSGCWWRDLGGPDFGFSWWFVLWLDVIVQSADGVRKYILNPRAVLHIEVKVKKDLQPIVDHGIRMLLGEDEGESPMIREEGKVCSPDPVAEFLEAEHDSEEFAFCG